ncbi:expressed unknown protein [Seminavis robusta]|uniref:Uncharacterized protein n=1 Tax=Seminavis robusta TaxID=568900 RepID=A0A9N8HM52_9STRA|nr:expressed unknown protein [Seminavis robusta]|eukprot:Sro1085_g239590.1 n/a (331) ;mRNA; f:9898-10890
MRNNLSLFFVALVLAAWSQHPVCESFSTLPRGSTHHERRRTSQLYLREESTLKKKNDDIDDDQKTKEQSIRQLLFGSAFVIENVFSYAFAPGADGTAFPQADLDLIAQLTDPQVMLQHPPAGYPLFSLLCFNSFLWLPFVWGGILYPTTTEQNRAVPALPFLLLSTVFGGVSLYPYFVLFRTQKQQDTINILDRVGNVLYGKFDSLLPKCLLLGVIGFCFYTFAQSISSAANYDSNLVSGELEGFVTLVTTSQFASTTVLDLFLLSPLLLDPIRDDAKQRGYLNTKENASWNGQDLRQLAPFAVPIIGALSWVLTRPPLLQDDNNNDDKS